MVCSQIHQAENELLDLAYVYNKGSRSFFIYFSCSFGALILHPMVVEPLNQHTRLLGPIPRATPESEVPLCCPF